MADADPFAQLQALTSEFLGPSFFARAFELMPDGVVFVDASAVIRYVNTKTEMLFGISRGNLIGKTIEYLVPDSTKEKHIPLRNTFIVKPAARVMAADKAMLTARHSDGHEFPVLISLGPIPADEGMFFMAVIRDLRDQVHGSQAT